MSNDFDPSSTMPGAPTGGLPAGAANLPLGAQQFIRSYTPADDDQGVIGSFELVSVYQTHKTKIAREGYPAEHPTKAGKTETGGAPNPNAPEIWENIVFVRISVRGNDKTEVHRPARDEDYRRFPFAYQQFKAGLGNTGRGTALSVIGMDASQVRIMHAKNVFTVEDLALVNDNNLSNLGAGAREWRHKANAYVAGRAPKVSDQVDELKSQLGEALALMKAQQAEIDALKAKRGPRRPPKAETE